MILVFRIIHNLIVLLPSLRGGWCSECRMSVTFLEFIVIKTFKWMLFQYLMSGDREGNTVV